MNVHWHRAQAAGTDQEGKGPHHPIAGQSRDDVWNELILQHRNLVLQAELPLFQPRDLQLIRRRRASQRLDRCIEIAVFDTKIVKPRFLFGIGYVHSSSRRPRYPNRQTQDIDKAASDRRANQCGWPIGGRHLKAAGPHISDRSTKEMGMQQAHLSALETKHADLDARIAEENQRPHPDDGLISRLKKEKLRLKEAIVGL
jgi:hypothetical protein